jgi:hypothetical protein
MEHAFEPRRRKFLLTAGTVAATPLLAGIAIPASAQKAGLAITANSQVTGRRKLGTLEVSSVGLGVQNMHRTYQTTIPSRSQMFDIIRTAFERGVTFFDTAEAYGPFECERILGEAIQPFRNRVVACALCTNDEDLELHAVLSGQVIAQLTGVTAAAHIRAGRLVPLLTQHVVERASLFLYYGSRAAQPARVRKFIDLASEKLVGNTTYVLSPEELVKAGRNGLRGVSPLTKPL